MIKFDIYVVQTYATYHGEWCESKQMKRHELQGTTSTVMNYLNIRIMGFPSHSHVACVWDSNLQETCQLLNSLRYLPEYSYRILRIFVLLFTWYEPIQSSFNGIFHVWAHHPRAPFRTCHPNHPTSSVTTNLHLNKLYSLILPQCPQYLGRRRSDAVS